MSPRELSEVRKRFILAVLAATCLAISSDDGWAKKEDGEDNMTAYDGKPGQYRPDFHFTPEKGWMNDPNGLVFYDGEYHMFFQHYPDSREWGPMHWGHAVSPDLVHWTEVPLALEPDSLGTIFSGSGVVDWGNTAGFGKDGKPALVFFYTSAGKFAKPPVDYTQSIAYSTDRGRTMVKYEGNPVVPNIRGANRDPKVIWHAPTNKWIMALYIDAKYFLLFGSADLKKWERLSEVRFDEAEDAGECPDFFPLGVDGDPANTKWVFWTAPTVYAIGGFDGKKFTMDGGLVRAGGGFDYAAQTWSDIPGSDGRRIQISWLTGGTYPGEPFNQQMSFPCELTLKTTPQGVRLCRMPIGEIESLYAKTHEWRNLMLKPGEPLVPKTDCQLFDISVEFEADPGASLVMYMRGHELVCNPGKRTLSWGERSVGVESVSGRTTLRVLVDRTSMEAFPGHGSSMLASCLLPESARNLELFSQSGNTRIVNLQIRELRPARVVRKTGRK